MQTAYNWHVTERCNYKCEFCFAKWDNPKEIWQDQDAVRKILNELSNKEVVYRKFGGTGKPIRINFAGGEPLILYEKFLAIIKLAKEMKFETSIITNGSLLKLNQDIYQYIDMLGISIDSLNTDTCRKIGRCDNSRKVLEKEQVEKLLIKARVENPDISIKFNVTVNRHNYNECVVEQLQGFTPNRIKILRQLPFRDNQGITEEQWSNFLMLNKRFFGENTIVEDNDDMVHSYLMIDPSGRFFQNGNKEDYIYSDPIHEVGLEKALSQIEFSKEKFMSRYKDTTKNEEVL
ncbi:MAG: viperin family antiviral radical SAM protein [Fibromonadaceae bacterium]|jgi:radical S-adenosyl methionine domain-containing protein 2|nr:viperin family antiviral radical SAM protein [Fibromonadaceae bacterium]